MGPRRASASRARSTFAALAVACIACAAPRPDGADEALAFAASGLPASIEQLSQGLHRSADTHATQLPADAAERLRSALRAAGEPDGLNAAARDAFFADAPPERVHAVARFHRGPVGARMLAFERRAGEPAAYPAFERYVEASFSEPVPVERVRVLRRIGEATGSAEMSGRVMAIAAAAGARAAAMAAAPGARAALPDETIARIEEARAQHVARLRNQASMILQFVYRDATDDELAAYLAFLESDDGRWLARAAHGTIDTLAPYLDAHLTTALSGAPPAP